LLYQFLSYFLKMIKIEIRRQKKSSYKQFTVVLRVMQVALLGDVN
jgi:hypothetical protein